MKCLRRQIDILKEIVFSKVKERIVLNWKENDCIHRCEIKHRRAGISCPNCLRAEVLNRCVNSEPQDHPGGRLPNLPAAPRL